MNGSSDASLKAGMADESNIIRNIEYIRPYEINCGTKGNSPLFHGVTGAEFSVQCPTGCQKD